MPMVKQHIPSDGDVAVFRPFPDPSDVGAMKEQLTIQFDGGCVPNPGEKYGSYEVRLWNKVILRELRFDLGWGTSNESEFGALQRAVAATLVDMAAGGFDPQDFAVTIITDSAIVANRLKDNWIPDKPGSRTGKRSMVMAGMADRCLIDLRRFAEFKIVWERRDSNVAVFGH